MDQFDRLDHVAIPVQEIASAVDWYTQTFRCKVKYQDATWALLGLNNVDVALVIPTQHPAHLGFMSPGADTVGGRQAGVGGRESSEGGAPGPLTCTPFGGWLLNFCYRNWRHEP